MMNLKELAAFLWNFSAWIGIISVVSFLYYCIVGKRKDKEEKRKRQKLVAELVELECDITDEGRSIFSNMSESKQREEIDRMIDIIERAYITIGLQDYN